MVAITYVEHDGTRHEIDVEEDMNLMEGATLNMVPGVVGMCGGICSCATCHCYVPPEWQDKIPGASLGERNMLGGAKYLQDNSRLGCQITVTSDLDGLTVYLPEEQGSVES
ncbi:MAG TPA: 2Fe-2S iron-sulfur cluster-binding protein [Spongiibacteraceae bacterium]|nr:2Fe-2S iron-sulfur cluster-binding protein [Spongiibacteraceae bacterium]